jgi:hypothetical protein
MNPVFNNSGQLDPLTMIENIVGLACVYYHDIGRATRFAAIAGVGNILQWNVSNPNVFTPNWFVTQQGHSLYVFVAGTDLSTGNYNHLWADVQGYTARRSSPDDTFQSQGWFSIAGDDISLAVQQLIAGLPPNTIQTVYLTGHSYGAGSAQWAGLSLARALPGLAVSVLAFATPKLILGNYPYAKPGVFISVNIWNDPVPYAPWNPVVGGLPISGIAGILLGNSGNAQWTDPSTRIFIMKDGTLSQNTDPNYGQIPPLAISVDAHRIGSYINQFAAYAQGMA